MPCSAPYNPAAGGVAHGAPDGPQVLHTHFVVLTRHDQPFGARLKSTVGGAIERLRIAGKMLAVVPRDVKTDARIDRNLACHGVYAALCLPVDVLGQTAPWY